MSPGLLLVFYCGLILLASLAGGWLPIFLRLTHRGMELAISFVAGVILGVGLLHLLPHGYRELGSIDETMAWVLFGFLVMFFIERFFQFHHHGPPADVPGLELAGDDDAHGHEHHDHGHHHGHAHHEPVPVARKGRLSWIGAAIGLTLHGAVEGIALAAAVAAESLESPAVAWAGFSTLLAIVLHKPFDSLTILTLMSASGASPQRRHLINAAYALVVPCGVALYLFAASRAGIQGDAFLGRSLGFAAGTFLCIATSDLLPELQFHSHDRFKLSAALLAGLALAWGLVVLEARGHDHHEHGAKPAAAHGHEQHSEDHDHESHGHEAHAH